MRAAGRPSLIAGLGLIIGLALIASLACAGEGVDEQPTATVATIVVPTTTPRSLVPTGEVSVTVENAIRACREKNAELLRSFVLDAVSLDEIQALFDRGLDVRLKSQSVPPVEDGRATVDVLLEITREAGIESVGRRWELERSDDGVWRFTKLPDCF